MRFPAVGYYTDSQVNVLKTVKPMIFTSQSQKKFSGLRPGMVRQAGYYWVKWSYINECIDRDAIWRIGFYNDRLHIWTLDGDERRFHDQDFLQIQERQIPMNWIFGNPSKAWLYILLAAIIGILTSCVFDIYKLITLIIK